MGEIKHRLSSTAPDIEYAEIYIPNENNLGTGQFTTVLKEGALVKNNPIVSMMIKRPIFQISVNINPQTFKIPILLGRADNSEPKDIVNFSLPRNIDKSAKYVLVVEFQEWKICSFKLNDISLERL